jgi:MAPEG family
LIATMVLETFPRPEELRGAVQGTLLYLSLYLFGFIQFQSYSKFYLYFRQKKQAKRDDNAPKVSFKEVKYYNAKDTMALVGDRTVGNFLEQSILFLPLLWMHALFIDPTQSFTLCLWYTISRSYYPFAFVTKTMYLSTIPGYIIVLYLMYQLIFQL